MEQNVPVTHPQSGWWLMISKHFASMSLSNFTWEDYQF